MYIEHLSYNPPTLAYYIEEPKGLFVLEGSFVLFAKATDIGNSLTVKLIGKNKIHFRDDTAI